MNAKIMKHNKNKAYSLIQIANKNRNFQNYK